MAKAKPKTDELAFPLAVGAYTENPLTTKLIQNAEWQGQIYALCSWKDWILFRSTSWPRTDTALCVPAESGDSALSSESLKSEWRAGMEDGKAGLFTLYSPEIAGGLDAIHLILEPAGSGVVVEDNENVAFDWSEAKLTWDALAGLPEADLQRICADVFETQINPKLSNPFVRPDERQDVPLHFERGSEPDLRRLTVYACHVHPNLFEGQKILKALYRADNDGKWHIFQVEESRGASERLTRLGTLLFEHNRFAGQRWIRRSNRPHRAQHYQWDLAQIEVAVTAPSAHEQAEALLALAEWLEGKVSPSERNALLDLQDAV